ncbi:hypothetical protein GF336_05965 [Candidatus Woesearchaeota archaeon]|nr:hypothetical protein [Candidatus Woesearchaeota archaeon]
MKAKAKKIFTNVRIIIALIFIVLALVAIHPNPWASGATIRNVAVNSSASLAGIESPEPNSPPMGRERIIAINSKPVESEADYHHIVSGLEPNRTVHIKTDEGLYKLKTRALTETIILDEIETVEVVEEVFDEETNTTKNVTKKVTRNKTRTIVKGTEDLGLSVYDSPSTNIRKGLELQGGTRVLLQPEEELTEEEMSMLIDNMRYRLNIYGLSDVIVREAGDLSGNQYVVAEIAGAKESEVKELLSRQGKFEAKVGNETVFRGGNDITYVCRSADCSGIDPMSGCGKAAENQWVCKFRFSISLTPEAAERQAEATDDLEVITDNNDQYLSEKLYLYLDNKQVDELNIGADLKGHAATEIAISGSGVGATQQEAVYNSLDNMKRMQTILITGSLPVSLEIVKTDSISPVFGAEFISNSLMIGLAAIAAVVIVIFLRYRRLKVAVPMLFTSITEVIILLGVASLIGWNLDLAAIAGIIIAVGTGVDHQVVITDETLEGSSGEIHDWKKRIKKAFGIIMGAYFTTFVAMIPLWFAGAGLLKGFALTTIIGISGGVLITRPAYASVIEILLKE